MAFKMKGSAFKLGNVATKSALKDVVPKIPKGASALAVENNRKQRQAHAQFHTDNPKLNENHETKERQIEMDKDPNLLPTNYPLPMKSPMKDQKANTKSSDRQAHTGAAHQHNWEGSTEEEVYPENYPETEEAKVKRLNEIRRKQEIERAAQKESPNEMKSPLENKQPYDKTKKITEQHNRPGEEEWAHNIAKHPAPNPTIPREMKKKDWKKKSGPKMKSPAKQLDKFRSSEDEAKRILTKGAAGTEFVKGARSKGGATSEKGKRTTYTKQDDGTYSKKVEKIKKGETAEGWKTKKDKTISSKKAERQVKRKTKKAARSGKKADIKEIRAHAKRLKGMAKTGEYDVNKKDVKEWKKGTIKATRKQFKENPEVFADR